MIAVVSKQRPRERAEVPTLETGHILDVDAGVRREDRADGTGPRLTVNTPRSGRRTSKLTRSSADFHRCKSSDGPISTVERRSGMPARAAFLRTGVVALALMFSSIQSWLNSSPRMPCGPT